MLGLHRAFIASISDQDKASAIGSESSHLLQLIPSHTSFLKGLFFFILFLFILSF